MRSKTNYKNQCGIYNGNSKYKNLIYCGVCGSAYHSNRDKGRIFYNCANKKLHGTAACNGVNVSEKQIDAYINWLANDMARVIIHYQNLQYISGMFHIINNLLQKILTSYTHTRVASYFKSAEICGYGLHLILIRELHQQRCINYICIFVRT
jgi:hypothetical protein